MEVTTTESIYGTTYLLPAIQIGPYKGTHILDTHLLASEGTKRIVRLKSSVMSW